jgi:enoyl-CoA hydratase/carnithine racemase
MSRAFVKDADEVEELPDRPISDHPNEVTREGLQQIEAALSAAQETYAAAQATGDREGLSHTRSFRLTQTIGERFRNMPKVTIAKIEGRARGGGSEIALAVDMCFAAVGKAIFGHPEVAIGLVPGGGATQRLPRLMGRGRALEVLLGCNDLSAELAERYGYINRALPVDELTPFVEQLALRIASFPAHAIAHAKAAVDNGAFGSMAEGLLVEAHESDLSVASEVTQARVAEALTAGAETYEGELEMNFLSRLSPTR